MYRQPCGPLGGAERGSAMKFSATLTMQYDTPFSPFSVQELPAGLDWCRNSGFDGVEICISHYRGLDIPAFRDSLAQRNLACSTISTGQARTLENISLLDADAAAVAACQQRILEHIDAAALLGSKVTLGLLRGIGTPGQEARDKKRLAEAMAPLVAYALQKNVVLLLEGINRYETSLLNRAAEVLDFIENDLGGPENVGVLWDVFHANIEDPDLPAVIDQLGGRLMHVHMADSNRMLPGYGHTDFPAIIRKLKAAGYSEYLSFECFNRPSKAIVRAEAGPFVRRMRTL